MWLCDIADFKVAAFNAYLGNESSVGTTNNSRQSNYRLQAGTIQHWGDDDTLAAPISYDPQVVGPFNHTQRGGWLLRYFEGAPKRLAIR